MLQMLQGGIEGSIVPIPVLVILPLRTLINVENFCTSLRPTAI